MESLSDEELLTRYRDLGCQQAFTTLHRRHNGKLKRGLRGLFEISKDEANDISQEAWIWVCRRYEQRLASKVDPILAELHPGRPCWGRQYSGNRLSFARWLWGLATRVLNDVVRQRNERLRGENMVAQCCSVHLPPDEDLQNADVIRTGNELLARHLPDELAPLIGLSNVDRQARSEAAAKVGVRESEVAAALTKAKESLWLQLGGTCAPERPKERLASKRRYPRHNEADWLWSDMDKLPNTEQQTLPLSKAAIRNARQQAGRTLESLSEPRRMFGRAA